MKTNWQHYKELELIPSSAREPRRNKLAIVFPLDKMWQLFLNALVQEHLYEQRTEYLERCWTLNYAEPYTVKTADQLHKLWSLMD